jgi:translation initiation factor IF-3
LKRKNTPINLSIKADQVMLIDQHGNKEGIVTIEEAMRKAELSSLDLVQVTPNDANPIVCKILDYGKYVFTKKKNTQSSNIKSKKTSLKEIKFRPSTDTGDYNIKLKKIKSFILSGDKTKISVRFRGREILNSNLGLELLQRLRADLEDCSQVDQEPSLEGRQLQMVLSPLKRK